MTESQPIDYNYASFDIHHVLSLDWWLHHLASAYRENPFHMLTELGLLVLVLWLIFKRDESKKPRSSDRLTVREQEQLLRDWKPEPLVPPALVQQYKDRVSPPAIHLSSGQGAIVHDSDNKEYINLSSHNYLGMACNKEVIDAAQETIKKYAVGSCGPRGFYGTMDIHLRLEHALSAYFDNEAIIYADYIGCPASVITAFAKRGDLLLIDEGCHYLITQGAILSRSNVIWFEHNNMDALEICLQTVNEQDVKSNRPLNRRFIVSEGIFHNSGDLCKLNKIIELKETYKYRLILDDSHGLGTVHEKGTPGYFNIKHSKVDMYFAGMDKALGSTGGFCIGNKEITHHQTLSGAGYVFSASAPPFSCTAAQTALRLLEENGKEYCQQVRSNAELMRKLLADDEHHAVARWNTGYNNVMSPLIHLRFNEKVIADDVAEQYFDSVASKARQQGVLVHSSIYLPQEFGISDKSDPRPSLRICVTREHTKEQLTKAAKIVKQLLVETIENKNQLDVDHQHVNDEEKQEED
eukprot:CAMPEP_0197031848 /NCGR_PEP_ID=MMETSP1384-20130603/10704_1 /TAXON_ID=29189 /ORGANISM="Ammonia sp." /LENGTH=522 /DNA_ID=CAMNT_0042461425 /DNA_START=28 /DNA_END=1596 /DNA_ORIENTATION=-